MPLASEESPRPTRPLTPTAWLALAAFVLLSFVGALPGALFPPGEWYAGLTKPAWNPPAAVFGPVWTLLYILMGVAAWLVWRLQVWSGRALTAWLVQLGLNALWTPLFFGAHWMGVAFVEICLLWTAIATTIVLFYRVRSLAGLLLAPYLAWVTFAAVLNFALWSLN